MNLLFIIPTFRKWGGTQEVVVMLADHFRRLGHRIVIVSEDSPATLEGRFSAVDVHYTLPLKGRAPWTLVRNLLGVMRIVRREHIDLISSHEKKTSALCVPVGLLLDVPVVHSAHSQMTNWRARWGRLGTHVVANSEATREHLIRVLRVRPEHITVILDAPKFMTVPSRADIERVRAEFGYAPDQPVLICLGRLTDEKGHAVLLQALARIRREFPRVRLLIVGKGHLRRELEKLTRALRLDDIVTFTGYRDDVSALLSAATVAVHPSLTDAAPFTNIECLRFGVPVISTEVGGISEVIRDGETGILVPRNDVPALAEAVCRALRDPKALRALTERGQLEVAARFSPAVMCQRYEDYFAAVLRRTLRSGLDAVAGISGCEPAQRIGGT